MTIHTVQKGDTIHSIAEQYNVPVSRILTDNNLAEDSILNEGQAIMIIQPSQIYIIKEGDTLESIAEANNITVLQLLQNNPELSENNSIYTGMEIVISYETDTSISIIGYTSTFITYQVLRRSLPYLTYLVILNYRFNAAGALIEINDSRIIDTAKEFGVAPIMFLSSMTESGRGSYALTHSLLNNLNAQELLIDNVLSNLISKGYEGLNIDFYSVLKEDLPLYIEFISNLTERLKPYGFEVFVTMSPHTFAYQPGTEYEPSYYNEIGSIADKVILMSYQWPQAYMNQMAETTVNYIQEYLDFVITQIPPEKIFIGVSRIAYDWELPYVEGETIGTTLSNAGAINLANQLGSPIEFDEISQTPYFYYNSAGIEHFVWFKDARSINAILDLVARYGLAGVALWNIMFYYSPTWLSIISQYNIEKHENHITELEETS